MACRCETPQPFDNPRYAGSCQVCARVIPSEWGSDQIRDLLDDFERSIKESGEIPEGWDAFKQMCLARELTGRDAFGLRFHGRDNCLDGLEEATDGANYALFDIIKARRTGEHIDRSLALTAVYHAWKLFVALSAMRAKRDGAP